VVTAIARNGEFCATVDPVARTAGILAQSVNFLSGIPQISRDWVDVLKMVSPGHLGHRQLAEKSPSCGGWVQQFIHSAAGAAAMTDLSCVGHCQCPTTQSHMLMFAGVNKMISYIH